MHLRTALMLLALTATAALVAAGCGGISSAEDVTEDDVQSFIDEFAAAFDDGDGGAVCDRLSSDAVDEMESEIDQIAGLAAMMGGDDGDVPEIENCADFFDFLFEMEGSEMDEFGDATVTDVRTEEDGDTTFVIATVETEQDGETDEDEVPMVVEDGELKLADFEGTGGESDDGMEMEMEGDEG